MTYRSRPTAVVVGGGIQGVAVALTLADRGCAVALLEREEDLLTRASRWNEGKVHLGFTYAADTSLRTAEAMVDGAMAMWPFLQRWIPTEDLRGGLSDPFTYAVHRTSMVTVEDVRAHLARCQAIAEDRLARGGTYLGVTSLAPPTTVDLDATYDEEVVEAAFRTDERAIDPAVIATGLRRAAAEHPRIEVHTGAEVTDIGLDEDGVQVRTTDGPITGDHLVNAAWAGRLTLDRQVGVAPPAPWQWRYKVGVFTDAGPSVPSTTVVLGEYGDVVTYANGNRYVSWYPVGRLHHGHGITPGEGWGAGDTGPLAPAILRGMADLLPALRTQGLEGARVRGDVIYSLGTTDIPDRDSAVHERHQIGVRTVAGRYHSIDTGKLTSAALHAGDVAGRILQGRVAAA